MVFLYYIDNHTIWVGKDKFENEELIHFSQRFVNSTGMTLIWFHADKFSSPHAYVRLNEGEIGVTKNLQNICCQIVKEGSIEGVKQNAIDVVYTPATNLMKTKTMNPGQVSFYQRNKSSVIRGVKKDQQILKTIEKMVQEVTMNDLEVELEDILAQKKNKSKGKKSNDDWDDWDEEPKQHQSQKTTKKSGVIDMFGDIPKAEFNPNMEDDFM